MHVLRKAKPPAVELDRGVDAVDDVADTDGGDRCSLACRSKLSRTYRSTTTCARARGRCRRSRSSASSAAMSSSESVKSKISAFSAIRSRCVDFGMTTRSRCDAPAQKHLGRRAPDALGDLARTRVLTRCRPVPSGLYASSATPVRPHASSSCRRYTNGLNCTWFTAGRVLGDRQQLVELARRRSWRRRSSARSRARAHAPSPATPRSARPAASG